MFLAALLTVIGYPVNGSVVVFDRIRETRASMATIAAGSNERPMMPLVGPRR